MEGCGTQGEGLGRSGGGECARCCIGVVVGRLDVCCRKAGEKRGNWPPGDVIYESWPVEAILHGDYVCVCVCASVWRC